MESLEAFFLFCRVFVIVHHKDAKDSKTRKESSLKDTPFANLGVLCAFAVHKRLYGERLQSLKTRSASAAAKPLNRLLQKVKCEISRKVTIWRGFGDVSSLGRNFVAMAAFSLSPFVLLCRTPWASELTSKARSPASLVHSTVRAVTALHMETYRVSSVHAQSGSCLHKPAAKQEPDCS